MDTTGKSREEIDALRELAAKAFAEGAYTEILRERPTWRTGLSLGRQWAAEELPYPIVVTRLREVPFLGSQHRLYGGRLEWRSSSGWRPYQEGEAECANIKALASLLTREQLLEIANGPCGPNETVALP